MSRSNLSTLAKAPSDSLEPPIDRAVNMTCYLLPVRSVQCLEKKEWDVNRITEMVSFELGKEIGIDVFTSRHECGTKKKS